MRIPLALTLLLVASACVAPRAVDPTPRPTLARPLPPPAPVRSAGDWRDWPVTAGTWRYAPDATGSAAQFGRGGEPLAVIRCDRRGGRVFVSMLGPAGALTVRTTSTARTLPAGPAGGEPAYVAATLAPADPLLDAMAFSRGRFTIEAAGLPPLVLPAWAEVGRVVEDCRP